MYSVNVRRIVNVMQYIVHNVHYSECNAVLVYSVRRIVNVMQYTMYSVQCSAYSEYNPIYSAQCTLCNVW